MPDVDTQSVNPVELLQAGAAAGAWTLDSSASSAEFAVKHFWGLMTVRGRMERFQGRAEVSQEGDISASLTFEAASVQTDNEARDRHLRSADFFGADEHPTVTFATGRVTLTEQGRARVEGTLTAAGRSQEVAFGATLQASSARAVVNAAITVDRTAFGMTWSPLGMAAARATLTVHLAFTHAA